MIFAATFLLSLGLSVQAAAPFAVTQPFSRLSPNAVFLNGMAVANGEPSTAWFEWGLAGRYANKTTAAEIGDGYEVVGIATILSNIVPNMTCQGRLVVSNGTAIKYGAPTFFSSAASVVAWGDNWFSEAAIPPAFTNVVAVGAGQYHTLAVRADGTVAAWGYDAHGQATPPAHLSDVVAVAAGYNHSVALNGDGTIDAWGDNSKGQTEVPAGLIDAIAIAAGNDHTLALRGNGRVVAWGLNSNGQTDVPPGLSNVVAVAAGADHSVALRADGTVAAWGDNSHSQTKVPPTLTDVVAVAAGGHHTFALLKDGTVAAWGHNSSGELNFPVGLTNIVAVAAGSHGGFAIRADASVVAWGFNGNREKIVPRGLTNAVAVAGGGVHAIALGNNLSGAPSIRKPKRDLRAILAASKARPDPLIAFVGKYSHKLALRTDKTQATSQPVVTAPPATPPSFLSIHQNPEGALLLLQGQPNTTYSIEGSTDLLGWEFLGSAEELSPGLFKFTDPDAATLLHRFYRASSD